jgi:hypothetical protein
MSKHRTFLAASLGAFALLTLAFAGPSAAQEPPPEPDIEKLGDERYRIGTIVVDRNTLSFTVPGKVLELDAPLEYVAVSRNGSKGYESLLELDTSPREFKLACILIGLDDQKSVKPRYQFDELKPEGPPVDITIHWERDGESISVSAANAMTAGDTTYDDDSWVYIGSAMSFDGRQFMADIAGTLIGFVHDPNSIIEHHHGAGIGAYGSITGNEKTMPPEGSPIMLEVAAGGQK